MKQLLPIFTLVMMLLATYAQAQDACTPDPDAPTDQPIYPIPHDGMGLATDTSGINLPACIGEPYQFTLTVRTPAVFESPAGPIALKNIEMAMSGAIKVIPPGEDMVTDNTPALANGMSYACNPPNCTFEKEVPGCIVLQGTPDFMGPDTLNLGIVVTLNFDPAGSLGFSFPDPTGTFPGNYLLEVKNAGDCVSSAYTLSQDIAFTAMPNPTTGYTDVLVESLQTGQFNFVVHDMLGRNLHRERVNLLVGQNRIPYDGSVLPSGIYTLSISNGQGVVSQRLVVRR